MPILTRLKSRRRCEHSLMVERHYVIVASVGSSPTVLVLFLIPYPHSDIQSE